MDKMCEACVGIGAVGEGDCELCSGRGTRVWLRVTAPNQVDRVRKAFEAASAGFREAMEKINPPKPGSGNSTDS